MSDSELTQAQSERDAARSALQFHKALLREMRDGCLGTCRALQDALKQDEVFGLSAIGLHARSLSDELVKQLLAGPADSGEPGAFDAEVTAAVEAATESAELEREREHERLKQRMHEARSTLVSALQGLSSDDDALLPAPQLLASADSRGDIRAV